MVIRDSWTDPRRREWDRVWRAKNREHLKVYQRERYRAKAFYQRITRQYGLTKEEFLSLLTSQGNACAICKAPFEETNTSRTRHVDHCHTTNRVRGILCFRCNTAIGKFKDDPDILDAAAAYLRKESK